MTTSRKVSSRFVLLDLPAYGLSRTDRHMIHELSWNHDNSDDICVSSCACVFFSQIFKASPNLHIAEGVFYCSFCFPVDLITKMNQFQHKHVICVPRLCNY